MTEGMYCKNKILIRTAQIVVPLLRPRTAGTARRTNASCEGEQENAGLENTTDGVARKLRQRGCVSELEHLAFAAGHLSELDSTATGAG